MGKDAGAAPTAPDPTKLLSQQTAADRSAFNYQTDANRYNTTGPDSTQTWNKSSVFDQAGYDNALKAWQQQNPQGTWVPGTAATPDQLSGTENGQTIPGTAATDGHWEGTANNGNPAPTQDQYTTYKYDLTNSLSPGAQALHDAQQGTQTTQQQTAQALLSKLSPTLGSSFDTSSAPGLVSNPGISGYLSQLGSLNPTQFDQNAADAAYSAQTRYLDPQVDQQQKALEARLSEQGFVPGTPGYQQAMQNFQDTNARAYGAARDSATTQGFNVGHTQFGDASSGLNSQIAAALSGANFQNSAHDTGVQDLLRERQVPLSDLNTILGSIGGGGFNPTNAGTAAVPQGGVGAVQTPDALSAYNQQYQNALGQYNAGVASDNNTTSTIGGLVGAIAIAF